MYINTTVLSAFASTKYISIFYILGSAGSVILLFYLPRIVQKIGLVKTTVGILVALTLSLLLLASTVTSGLFIGIFMLYIAVSGTMWYCNDLFVSHYTKNGTVGHTRGSYLTIINTAIAIMPVITGIIVERNGFSGVYVVGALLLCIAIGIILYSQRGFVDHSYASTTIAAAWEKIRLSPSLRRVVSINFILQFFYVWMTLFTPLYLYTVLHFNWGEIGAMFSIMLLAFVILQYPIGRLADSMGEKKLLIAGLTIAALSTVAFALLARSSHSFAAYAAILFATRVGVCMVEVLTETYFFKQINDSEESVVSIYRMMYPLAYIIAPLIGWAIIATISYTALFICLGILLFIGAIYTLRLVDIR
jgi:MFS family permease